MQKRCITVALCLILLFASGCAQNAQPALAEESISPSSTPGGDVLDFPAISSTPAVVPEAEAEDTQEADGTSTQSPEAEQMKNTSSPENATEPAYDMTRVDNEDGYIKGHDVNLRKGPGTEHDIVDQLAYHDNVVITAKNDLWYHLECGDGVSGYMLKEFVGVGPIPSPTLTPKPTPKSTKTPAPTRKPTPEPVIEAGEEVDYSKEDVYLVAKLIYAEGKNQSDESFLAMASVVYNRCNSSKFGGTPAQEVYRSNQFSVVRYDGFEDLIPSAAAYRNAQEVFLKGNRTIPAGVMYFRSARSGEYWSSSRTFYKKIGGNNYYY